jgi:aldehyde dehydrogenase (NAD+)
VPKGVFNMVQGDGPTVGAAISSHPEVDMVSFTGSTRAGIEVAKAAAPTVKRVAQELGGKSPNIVLDDDAFAKGVGRGVATMMVNSGQSCNAPPACWSPQADGRSDHGGPRNGGRRHGRRPQRQQPARPGGLQGAVRQDPEADPGRIDEGATLVIGGTGRPRASTRATM